MSNVIEQRTYFNFFYNKNLLQEHCKCYRKLLVMIHYEKQEFSNDINLLNENREGVEDEPWTYE